MAKLSDTQTEALVRVNREGRVHARDGVAVSTAKVLAQLGLVKFQTNGTRPLVNRTTGQVKHVADWNISRL